MSLEVKTQINGISGACIEDTLDTHQHRKKPMSSLSTEFSRHYLPKKLVAQLHRNLIISFAKALYLSSDRITNVQHNFVRVICDCDELVYGTLSLFDAHVSCDFIFDSMNPFVVQTLTAIIIISGSIVDLAKKDLRSRAHR